MVKVESKAKLAKLLAMENIDIQHKQVKTAMFDVKNRCLILPTWKDMPNHLYDLLVGHEVGHALYTPNDENQLKELIKKSSKHCVNVVEDARIEFLMKKRYPGLVKSFYNGYQHLIEKDFFGLSSMNFETINLLDKLNLYFKVPSAVLGIVEFDEIEQTFVDRIEQIRNFDELEEICVDICNYIKENRPEDEEENEEQYDEGNSDLDGDDDWDYQPDESGEDSETEEETEKSSGEEDSEEEGEEEIDQTKSDADDQEETNETGMDNPDYDTPDYTPNDLKSETMENFEKSLDNLNDVDTQNEYLTLPKDILDNNINDYKDVWKNFNEFYDLETYRELVKEGNEAVRTRYDWGFDNEGLFVQQTDAIFIRAKETIDKIKKESSKNVSHMAMEFERKKCADIYKRTSFSKTGVLDTNKMFSAKYNEDVFKKNMKTPDGKNHGLCIFVDWSGSMSINMAGCIKQLIELMLFCKKVNIPFEVYSFTDVGCSSKLPSFNYRQGDLVTDRTVTLNNYFSSRMNTRSFNEALINICVISNSFLNGYQQYPIPEQDRLGYTPLNGAIIASEKIIKDFRKRNSIQKVHSVWITDGEGNNNYTKYEFKDGAPVYNAVSRYGKQLVIQDEVMKKNYKVTGRYLTPSLFEIVKDRLGCNVVGFFLDVGFGNKNTLLSHWYSMTETQRKKNIKNGVPMQPNEFLQKARKDGFLVRTMGGYDEYYVISNKPVVIKVNEIDDKMTARKMASIFSAKSTQFKKTRIILSRFIDLITV